MRRELFITCLFSILIMVVGPTLALAETTSTTTVQLSTAIHFLNPAGDDVEVGPGTYQVEPAESWLKIVPEGEEATAAVLIEASRGTHEEEITKQAVRLEPSATNLDVVHLALLLPDGTGLEAVGTRSGIRPRGLALSFLKKQTTSKSTLTFNRVTRPKTPTPQLDKRESTGKRVCGPFHKTIASIGGTRRPALAVFQNKLHLVTSFQGPGLKGPFHNMLSHRIYQNGKWSQGKKIPNQMSKKGVGLAAFGNHLHMVHLGKSSNQLWHSMYVGNTWSPNVKIEGQKSKERPELAAFNNELHMVHLGDSSNDIWHSRFIPGRGWTRNVRIPQQKSKHTPGLAVYQNRLHMVHTGNSSRNLLHSIFSRGQWSPNVYNSLYSWKPPTLVFDSNNPTPFMEIIHFMGVSWYDKDLHHSLYDSPKWFDGKTLADIKSDSAVGVAFFEGCWHMVSVKNKNLMHTTFATSEIHPNVR